MRRALAEGRRVGAAVITHAEDRTLACGGVMDAGPVAERLGLPGMPASAESVMVERDCALAAATGAHLHVAHISTAGAVAAVRAARAAGTRVSRGSDAASSDARGRGRGRARHARQDESAAPDRRGRRGGARRTLADGTLEVIASDHAPHHVDEKARGMTAPAGSPRLRSASSGLETTLALVLALVHAGLLAAATAIRALTIGPAAALGVAGGHLRTGERRRRDAHRSRTPLDGRPGGVPFAEPEHAFAGRAMRGRALAVCLAGRVVDGELEGRFRR